MPNRQTNKMKEGQNEQARDKRNAKRLELHKRGEKVSC